MTKIKNECAFKFEKKTLKKLRKKSLGVRHIVMQSRAKKIQICKATR